MMAIDRLESAAVCLPEDETDSRARKLLFVDDEAELLNLFSAVFMDNHEVVTAQSAEEALKILQKDSGFAVVTADLNMPGTDGISFLSEVRALAPDAVRLMLTGFGTRESAISAVNDADVFKFLTKPIHVAPLRDAIDEALAEHEKTRVERALLEQTVRGSVGMLVEVLSMAQPVVFGRAAERAQLVSRLCDALKIRDRWQLEAAALLGNLGMLSLPKEVLDKAIGGDELSNAELQLIYAQTDVAAELVRRVPRLEPVADAIRLQHKNFNGTGHPVSRTESGVGLPTGARMLRLLNAYLRLQAQGASNEEAIAALQRDEALFDKRLLVALAAIARSNDEVTTVRSVPINSLREGAVIAHDVYNDLGQLIVRGGQQVTGFLAEHLRSFEASGQIPSMISVREATRSKRDSPAPAEQQAAGDKS